MYKFVKPNSRRHRYIDIVIIFDTPYSNVNVAAARAKHPDKLAAEKRRTDIELAFYNSFLDSAADAIQKYFTISDEGQSGGGQA